MEEALLKANRTTEPDVKVVSPEWHDGDAQLRKIARAGRKWKMTIGRKVDMESESNALTFQSYLTDGHQL